MPSANGGWDSGPHRWAEMWRRANDDLLGNIESSGGSVRVWSEFGSGDLDISGNKVVSTAAQGTWSLARMGGGSLGLGATANYVEANFTLPATGTAGAMCFLRKADSITQTFYAAELSQAGGSATLAITEWTAGSRAVLTSKAYGAAGQTVHIVFKVDGALLRLYVLGTKELETTDSTIPADATNAYVGFGLDGAVSCNRIACGQFSDSFSAPTGATYRTGTRNPLTWPFSRHSVWNRPIGAGATTEAISTSGPMGAGANIEAKAAIRAGVFQAAGGDPLEPIYVRDLGIVFDKINVPAAAQSYGYHNGLAIMHQDGERMLCITQGTGNATKFSGSDGLGWGGRTYRHNQWLSPKDSNRFENSVGTNADGHPIIRGLIRQGELSGGIFHVMQALLYGTNLRPTLVRWPANQDIDGSTATSGNLMAGTLLTIPQSVDLGTLGITNSLATNVAVALQDFGVYLVDRGGYGNQGFALGVAWDAADDFPTGHTTINITRDPNHAFWQGLDIAFRQLKVVTNNTPTTVAGGGTPVDLLPASFTSGTVPADPTNLSSPSQTDTTINLAWSDNATDETSYEVEYKRTVDPDYTAITGLAIDLSSYTVTGLTQSTSYDLRVRCRNATGPSGYSNVLTVSTGATPQAPTAPSNCAVIALAYDQVRVSWTDNSPNETGFKVEISRDQGAFSEVTTTAANAVSYDYTIPSPGDGEILIQARVRATNATGDSAYSTSGTVTTPAKSGPGPTFPASPVFPGSPGYPGSPDFPINPVFPS